MNPKYISSLAGALVFFWIYGFRILNPESISWLMKGDTGLHFLGWHFFRREEWSFPLGTIKSYLYPYGTSLVYTDSIPLLTIPLKIFAPILPDPFQFHGIWMLTCYVLQGYFGALLFSRFTDNRAVIILGSLFFLLNPVLVQRSGYHLALVSHWLILASLYLYFGGFNKADKFKWGGLLVATVLVQFYLLVMILIIWSAFLVKNWLENRNLINVLGFMATVLFSLLLTMWLVGYFVISPDQAVAGGFGYYSMNLVSPFNPAPYDHFTFIKPLDIEDKIQFEGFSYLGFGALTLLCLSCYVWVKGKIIINPKKYLPLMGAALALTLLAVSNKVVFAETVLFTLKLPDLLDKGLNIIRSSGRMFWPVIYLIILSSAIVTLKRYGSKITILILSATLVLQIIDFFPGYNNVKLGNWKYYSLLKSDSWNKIIKHTRHITSIPPFIDGNDYLPFALLAANNGKTINGGRVARTDYIKKEKYQKDILKKFESGNLREDTLYIVLNPSLVRESYPSHKIGILDRFLIVFPDIPIPDLKPMELVFEEGEKNSITQVVEHYSKSGHIILMSVKGEGTNNLPHDFRELIKNKGGKIENLVHGGSYIAVIHEEALAHELLDNNAKVELATSIGKYQINMTSVGWNIGNHAKIEVNGISLTKYQRGFNIVIINPENGKTIVYSYDTYAQNWDYKLPEKRLTLLP